VTNQKKRKPSETRRLLAGRTMFALASALRDLGLSSSELKEICESIESAPRGRLKSGLRENATDSAQLGTALTLWHRDPRFVDVHTGRPVPLKAFGRSPSIEALLRRAGIRSSVRYWATFLIDAQLVRRCPKGLYTPAGRSARMPALNALHIDHLALGVANLVKSAYRNFTPQGLRRPFLQGAAVVKNLPTGSREAFRTYINAQGDSFLATADDWMESRAIPQGTRRGQSKENKKSTAAVYAFAFFD
jgi:hypothetical protein